MKKKGIKFTALMMAAVLALSACGGSSDSGNTTAAPAAGETAAAAEVPAGESISQDTDVVAAVRVDFTTMDPMDTSDTLSGGIQRMMLDGLFGFDD